MRAKGTITGILALGLLATISVWGAGRPQRNGAATATPTASSPALERRPLYRVEPGDVLSLEFPFTPEMNQTVTLTPDGYVSLRGLGPFYAEGKTTPELGASLESAYGKILRNPVITVDLKNFQQPYFIVGGQVGHPGKYDLREPTTAIEALAIAGGMTPASKNSQVLLFRPVGGGRVQVTKLDVKRMLHTRNLDEDVMLRPGDMLYVPKNFISKIARFLPTDAMSMYFKSPVP